MHYVCDFPIDELADFPRGHNLAHPLPRCIPVIPLPLPAWHNAPPAMVVCKIQDDGRSYAIEAMTRPNFNHLFEAQNQGPCRRADCRPAFPPARATGALCTPPVPSRPVRTPGKTPAKTHQSPLKRLSKESAFLEELHRKLPGPKVLIFPGCRITAAWRFSTNPDDQPINYLRPSPSFSETIIRRAFKLRRPFSFDKPAPLVQTVHAGNKPKLQLLGALP